MNLNRIQIQIFKQLSAAQGLEVDAYIRQFAQEFLCVEKERLDALNEQEGDAWIEKAYLQSLNQKPIGK